MYFAPVFAHAPSGHFGEPIIDASKQRENRSRRDHVMEVGNYIIRIMQMQIGEIETQWQAGEPADAEHWQECQGEQ